MLYYFSSSMVRSLCTSSSQISSSFLPSVSMIMSAAASYLARRFSISSVINGTVLLFSISGRSWLSLTRSRIVSGFAVRRTTRPFFFISTTLHSLIGVPPPQEITTLLRDCISMRRFVSRLRKYCSPYVSKISEILIPCLWAMI